MEPEPEVEEQPEQEAKSLNHHSLYYTYLQRYFVTFESASHFVHMHSNGYVLMHPDYSSSLWSSRHSPRSRWKSRMSLSPSRSRERRKVQSYYDAGGGVKVKPKTHVAHIVCEEHEVFKVEAKVEGNVIEFNERLTVDKLGSDEGYFVIILPTRKFVPEAVGMKQISYHWLYSIDHCSRGFKSNWAFFFIIKILLKR